MAIGAQAMMAQTFATKLAFMSSTTKTLMPFTLVKPEVEKLGYFIVLNNTRMITCGIDGNIFRGLDFDESMEVGLSLNTIIQTNCSNLMAPSY